MEFQAFPKIARLSRECVVTEKIDGTNAQINIVQAVKMPEGHEDWPYKPEPNAIDYFYAADGSCWNILAGSRNRWLQPGNGDNAGFAAWVIENKQELIKLGPGQHFGEWWGSDIQRRYGLTEKRFSLFNTFRWHDAYQAMLAGYENNFPKCCHVVPVLHKGIFTTMAVQACVDELITQGSRAAPGFMDPEGVIVYHEAAKIMFKKTCKDDEKPKGQVQ